MAAVLWPAPGSAQGMENARSVTVSVGTGLTLRGNVITEAVGRIDGRPTVFVEQGYGNHFSDALRLRACDVLLAAGQHDPQPLRLFIEGAVPGGPPGAKPAEDNRRLLGTLIATLGTPNENGLQEQVQRRPQ